MRVFLIVFLMICTPALASAPGEPADCNDWQLLEPGLGCEIVTQAFPCNHGDGAFDPWCHLPLAGVVMDNLESAYRVRDLLSGIEVLRVVGGQETVIARLVDDPDGVQTCDCCTERYPACLAFHAASGRLLVSVELLPYNSTPSNGIPAGTRTFALSGLASMHELALSYDPVNESFGLRVPVSPEGLGQADRFDVYTGPVTRPLDLGNGAPFRCGMPGSAAGSWVPLGTLPDPGPGSASWILSTVSDDGNTRAGREAPAGVLRGRDPARLPRCL